MRADLKVAETVQTDRTVLKALMTKAVPRMAPVLSLAKTVRAARADLKVAETV